MKKLKLDLQHLDNAEVLTRSQLKQILGGDSGSGICYSGTCTLYIEGDGNVWVPRSGYCKLNYDIFNCYCETGLGDLPLNHDKPSKCFNS